MTTLLRLSVAALTIAAALNAQADSIASSASSAGSDSSGSVSDSIHGSSDSSSNSSVANRDYHVVDVAQAPQKPGMARITMAANDNDWRVMLDVPQAVVDREQLKSGAAVHAQQRDYGIAFEHGDTRQAFFLALNDDWTNEFAARKVSL